MSEWKWMENRYILHEILFGPNRYFWYGYIVDNNLSEKNKSVYRTLLRTFKNKKRKIKYFQRKIKEGKRIYG